ncbi:YidC/Oxa1 family membrane protein insertase [Candidatus Microgenomates bacterium]|nr:YidC/Oxa1 family membrane protein insertase [Candidatus Microgenomates bacterium]
MNKSAVISHNIFNSIFVIPTLNLLALFLVMFNAIHLPGAFGFSIIALVLLVRMLLHPVFVQMIKSQQKIAEIKPHLDKLQAKHKKDPKMLQQEQMRLYKEAGINPASGCLTAIIQMPVFIGLYSTLNIFLHDGTSAKAINEINKILYIPALKIQHVDTHFFGLNLAVSPQKAGMWFYYLVPVVTGLLQYAQAKYATPQALTPATPAPKKSDKKLAVKGEEPEEKKDSQGDFQKAMNTQMKYFFPFMIGYFAFTLPVGLSLYWNIFSIFSILQYRRVSKSS